MESDVCIGRVQEPGSFESDVCKTAGPTDTTVCRTALKRADAGAEAQARERANKAQATADEQLKVAAKLVDEATVKSTELTRAAEAKTKALTADATSSLVPSSRRQSKRPMPSRRKEQDPRAGRKPQGSSERGVDLEALLSQNAITYRKSLPRSTRHKARRIQHTIHTSHITSVISRHPAAGIRNGVERDTAHRPVECVAGLHTWKELGHCRVHAPHACAALPRLILSYFPPQVSLTLSTDSHTGVAAKSSRRGKSASCSALRTGGARMYAVGS